MILTERNKCIEIDPKVRAKSFDEVSEGFNEELMLKEASRCLECRHAPCKKGCPVGVNIPEFIKELKNNNPIKACEIIKGTNSLPAVCGRVCPQENQCEKLCVRNKSGGAVSIGALERYSADAALNAGKQVVEKPKMLPYKVAVIGSGPAGLSCAGELASKGVQVTVFEAFHKTGGVLVYGIPEFRLPKSLVQKEIEQLKELGVEFKVDSVIGKFVTLQQLKEDYDFVFIGTGAGLPIFLNIEGENLNGVSSANEYLTRVNLMKAYDKDSDTPVQKGKNVIIVGAGNVAMDAARTALRLGAEKVSLVYRRSREEMPARKDEIHHAEEEGVEFHLLSNPLRIIGENGWVKKMVCMQMELGESDATGRRRPVETGNLFEIECDQVIMSIGTSPNPLLTKTVKELKTEGAGIITVDENNLTSISNVYAGGDAVTGAATVILAMGAGRNAAKAMLKQLGVE